MYSKEFVSYEQALALKELGFDEECLGYYYTLNGKDWKFAEKSEYNRLDDEINIGGKFSLLAPLYQQAFKWFREKHNLYGDVYPIQSWEDKFCYNITYLNKKSRIRSFYGEQPPGFAMGVKDTWEEAEAECIKDLIKIVKENTSKKELTLCGIWEDDERWYFTDYCYGNFRIGDEFLINENTLVKLVGIKNQFLNDINRIPNGFNVLVQLEFISDIPNEIKELPLTKGFGYNENGVKLKYKI